MTIGIEEKHRLTRIKILQIMIDDGYTNDEINFHLKQWFANAEWSVTLELMRDQTTHNEIVQDARNTRLNSKE